MELKVVEERANPLLKRTDYRFEIAHPEASTPKRSEVQAELAKAVKVPKERLIIGRMNARFGTAVTVGEASAYQTKEAVDTIVPEYLLVRHGLREKKAKGPAAPAPEPTPAATPAAAPATPAAEPAKGA